MYVAVGLSGGVDSSVAALLLKQQGHKVVALFMQNWHDTAGTLYGDCHWKEDLAIAQLVARNLDIPFHFIDLSEAYRKKVVDYMFEEYRQGRTPNPDVLCNREIKFDLFLKEALALGVDAIATGHYCRKEQLNQGNGVIYRLLAGSDPNKDQSYFLCQLSQQQLEKALFPVGNLMKPEVRKLAAEAGLPSADKKDSQGICFVGKVNLPVFLQQKLAAKEGDIIEIMPDFYSRQPPRKTLQEICAGYTYRPNDGKKVGIHNGAHFFTIGQRHGLHVGGHTEPLFVIATNVNTNTVYTGEGHAHQGLQRKGLFVAAHHIHWIRHDKCMAVGQERACKVRIRYRQPLQEAILYRKEEGLYVIFHNNQRGITPGQFAAWYEEDELLGSGIIHA